MPRIASTHDVLNRARTALAHETAGHAGADGRFSAAEERALAPGLLKDAVAAVRARQPTGTLRADDVTAAAVELLTLLIGAVDTRGKGTLSQSELKALRARHADAGAHVAHAYELVTGKSVDKPAPGSLASLLPADWRAALEDELGQPYFKELEKFLVEERKHHTILPPPDVVFAALKRTPLEKVKVVLLGQDPYPQAGNANGLSFSVATGKPIPASLRNMFTTMQKDVGGPMPSSGNLERWADQGVLLLNTILTVREGEPNSHRNKGWERFTTAILDKVNAKHDRVVFMLLGKQAQEMGSHVDTSRHAIVAAPHPSPITPGNPFGKTRPYSAVNNALADAGRSPIHWQLPGA